MAGVQMVMCADAAAARARRMTARDMLASSKKGASVGKGKVKGQRRTSRVAVYEKR